MSRSRPLAALLPLALLCCGAARAEDPISTDRPDFVESSSTVGAGRWQLETSAAWERDREGGTQATTWSTPTLLRVGVGAQWELRMETDGWQHARVTEAGAAAGASGMGDLSLGAKYHIAHAGPGGASMAWLLHADVPSGADAFAGHGVRPSLRLTAEWALPHDTGLGVMAGVVHDSDDNGHRFDAGILAMTAGHGFTPRLRGFVEVAGQQLAARAHGGNLVTFDTGATWLLDDDSQLDVAANFGLTSLAPDRALTVGWSRRW
ncbi:MAG: transporter [Lysobacteraceae bacterium]